MAKPARKPATYAYTIQEHERVIRFSLFELYASGIEHNKLKKAI